MRREEPVLPHPLAPGICPPPTCAPIPQRNHCEQLGMFFFRDLSHAFPFTHVESCAAWMAGWSAAFTSRASVSTAALTGYRKPRGLKQRSLPVPQCLWVRSRRSSCLCRAGFLLRVSQAEADVCRVGSLLEPVGRIHFQAHSVAAEFSPMWL